MARRHRAGRAHADRTRSAQLGRIQPKTHAPPRIRFVWGQGLSFRAIVDNVQQKFTLFNPSGIPVRATLTVSFKEYKTLEEQLKELNLQSADHTKRRVVRSRDTLARIAFEEYGDASAVAPHRRPRGQPPACSPTCAGCRPASSWRSRPSTSSIARDARP